MMKIAPYIQISEEINLLIEEINKNKNAEEGLKELTSRCMELFHPEMIGVWHKKTDLELSIALGTGKKREILTKVLPQIPALEVWHAGSRVEQLNIENQLIFFANQINELLKYNIKYLLTVPLVHIGEPTGIFVLFYKEPPDQAVVEMINILTPFMSSLLQELRMREAMQEREKDLKLLIWGTETLIQVESETQLFTEAGEMSMLFNLEAGFFFMQEDQWRIRVPFGRLLENENGCRWIVQQLQKNPNEEYKAHEKSTFYNLSTIQHGIDFPWENLLIQPLETHSGIIGELWLLETGDTLENRQEIFAAFGRNLGAALQSIRERDKLERLATTDGLTEILNRKGLELQIRAIISETQRRGSTFLLLILDLDGFKNLNDTQGHPAGDRALRILAQNLKEAVREYDVLARTGGDEFSLILKDIAKTEEAIAVIERMRDKMGLEQFNLGVSIGVAEFPTEADNYEGLYQLADRRLYKSKHSVKGQIVTSE